MGTQNIPEYPIRKELSEARSCIQELKKSLLKIGLPEDHYLFVELKNTACSTFIKLAEKEGFNAISLPDNSQGGPKKERMPLIDASFLDFYVETEIIALHAILSGISAGVSQFLTSIENGLEIDEN